MKFVIKKTILFLLLGFTIEENIKLKQQKDGYILFFVMLMFVEN